MNLRLKILGKYTEMYEEIADISMVDAETIQVTVRNNSYTLSPEEEVD